MSDIKIVSPSTGTATFTLTTPSGTSTDRTLTLPDQTSGTVLTTESNVAPKVPTMMVEKTSNQSFSVTTWNKVSWDNVAWDTDSGYDATNKRYTPPVAGYYLNTVSLTMNTTEFNLMAIYKNGTEVARMDQKYSGTTGGFSGSALLEANGSTDYFEVYIFQGHIGTGTLSGVAARSNWSVILLRGN